MSEHTQGKLRLSITSPTVFVEDNLPISDRGVVVGNACGYDNSGYFPSDAEGRENARRIVAAWNACQGIPTEALEAQQSGGLPWSVADQIEARVVQAELVGALGVFVGSNSSEETITITVRTEHIRRARALIAQVTGAA